MIRRALCRVLLAALVTVPMAALIAAPSASAGPATVPCGPEGGDKVPGCSVTVSETANLHDGQVVTVSWVGMDPSKEIHLIECGVPPATAQQGGGAGQIPCQSTDEGVKVPAGASSAQFTVRTGRMGSAQCPPAPGTTFAIGLHKGQPGYCQISVLQGAGAFDPHNSLVRIDFAAPAASTTAPPATTATTAAPATTDAVSTTVTTAPTTSAVAADVVKDDGGGGGSAGPIAALAAVGALVLGGGAAIAIRRRRSATGPS
jgi:hypothetical protein